ncbi:hypothetical protein PCE1_002417 [Barthelona sp. PCE]
MKVLITGGLGFIGSNLIDHIRACFPLNVDIVIMDDQSTGKNFCVLEHDKVDYYEGDISIQQDLEKLPTDITHCVHLAAAISVAESVKDPEKYHRINVEGSRKLFNHLITTCPNLVKICGASSAAVYGNELRLPIKEYYCEGDSFLSPYAESKYLMEKIMGELEIDTCAFRFFNVFGPRQDPKSPYTGVISIFMDRALANKKLIIFGDGEQSRDFIFVHDLCRAITTYLFENHPGHLVMNLGTGKTSTITELADTCVTVCKSASEIEYGPEREGDIKHSCSCVEVAKTVLKWEAIESLTTGLPLVLDFMQENFGEKQIVTLETSSAAGVQ